MVSENPYFSGEGKIGQPQPKDLVFATTGIASSQVRVGLCYLLGLGVKHDFSEAQIWFEKAAKQGNACGLFNVALMYEQGKVEGGAPDISKAVHYYERAALKGHAESQLNLGILYVNGEGVEEDIPKAIQLFVASAKCGNRVAEFLLVVLREHWQPEDSETSFLPLLLSSAHKGYPPAQELLGTYYFEASDFQMALYWCEQAALQGQVPAMYRLGLIYSSQEYKDLVLAYIFVSKGLERSQSDDLAAMDMLRRLETIMSPEELDEAKEQCKNFIINDCAPDESAVDLYDIREN